MKGYNSVGMSYDGDIIVSIGKDEPIEALFSKDKIQVGNMSFAPKKNVEILIKVKIESE